MISDIIFIEKVCMLNITLILLLNAVFFHLESNTYFILAHLKKMLF